jgi:CheY-like chemotaxis protein
VHPILAAIFKLLDRRKSRIAPDRAPVTILCLLGEENDQRVIEELCRDRAWSVLFARDLEEAQRLLERTEFQILLLDRDLTGDRWREAMTRLVTPSGALCILLVSKVFDDYLWNEVVRNGGYDVLPKPLRPPDVARAVKLAWSYWASGNGHSARFIR